MEQRLKQIRKHFHLTQEDFADRLGIKRSAISNYEIGRNEPIDAVVSLICREFNVNERWLRTGEGEMFDQREENAVERLCVELHASELESRIVRAYFSIDPRIREAFMQQLIQKMQTEYPTEPAAPVFTPMHTPTIEEEARAEADQHTQQIYQQILAEKRAAAGLSPESFEPKVGDGMVI